MKKTILFICSILLCFNMVALAGTIDRNASVAVMDFGTRPGATTAEININNAEHVSCDYIITRLVNRQCFNVMEKELALNTAKAEGLKVVGLIDPDSAKRIGELLKTKYLIYGNVTNVSVSDTGTSIVGNIGGGVNVCTVKAHIMARMMDIETGNIIAIAKGDGKSKSSFVKIAAGNSLMNVNVVKIGTARVTQDSVHNAIQKAAYAAADGLMFKLFSEPKLKI